MQSKNPHKTKSIFLQLLGVTICTIAIIYFAINYIDQLIPAYKQNYQSQKKETAKELFDIEYYYHMVQGGERSLENKNYSAAQHEFITALKYRPNDRRANLGLTKVLLNDCKQRKINCELSNQYYQKFISSSNLTKKELINLDSYR